MSHPTGINAIREELRGTQAELLAALDSADPAALYHRAAEGVWTLAQVLTHISEARRFFVRETLRVLSSPESKMGRTMADPGRLVAVNEATRPSAESLRDALVTSHTELMDGLGKLTDANLQIYGEHVKFGRQTLGEFIQHFVVEHDHKHVQQARRCLAQAKQLATSN